MGILDSKKELAAMQEAVEQLRTDVDRLKKLVLAISKQIPAPSDPPQNDEKLFANPGPTTFVYQGGEFNKFTKQ